MNKYHDILEKIMRTGKMQHNKKRKSQVPVE